METKARFRGKPLIEIPSIVPQIGYLEGDFGSQFLKEYNALAKSDYNGNRNLSVLNYSDGIVKGSNPFAVVLANQVLRQQNLRTATQADLEKALKLGVLNLRGTYEDTGLVLRTEEDTDYRTNTPVAKHLASQLRERGATFSPENPLVVPLTGLQLEKSDNNYGLVFKLEDDAGFYNTPILTQDGQFSSEDIDEQIGLPVKAEGGNRTLYVRNSGLSRLYLFNDLDVYSYDRDLVNSNSDGRVVAVSTEGANARENLESELFSEITEKYNAEFESLNSRKAEAEKAVREIMSRK